MTPLLRKQTVGLIIIGDEILNGRVEDTNSRFALKQFFQWGAKVKRITVLPDEIESISDEVAKFAEMYDFVVTTGGIGPTDDDVTYRAVAKVRKFACWLSLGLACWLSLGLIYFSVFNVE